MIRVQSEPFDAGKELAALIGRASDPGAVAYFVGLVCADLGAQPTETLELQHYAGFTERGIGEIASAAQERFQLEELVVIHRYGNLRAGEAIVFVGAAAKHRREAFDAVDYVMDRLKTEAAFWKREVGPAGSRWIEARNSDWRDRSRWEQH